MTSPDRPYTFDRVVRLLLSVVALTAVFLLMRYLSDVLLPFAAAVILAYLLNPLVGQFERKTGSRGLAVFITLSGLGLVALALMAILVPLVLGQARRFRDDLDRLHRDLPLTAAAAAESATPAPTASPVLPVEAERTALGWRELTNAWRQYRQNAGETPRAERLRTFRKALAGTYVGGVIDSLLQYLRSEDFRALAAEGLKRIAVGGWTVLTFGINVLIGLAGLIIVLVYLVFLLLDFPEYARQWRNFLPPTYRSAIVEFLEQFNTAMRRYFRGQSVVALITGALFVIGFSLIGLPLAVPLGMFIGLLNMVPYLQSVGLVPAFFFAALRALEGDSGLVMSIAWVAIIFIVVQVIQDALITPRIMGQATGLRPVAILLGVFIWGKLLGFLGLLLAIPLTCLGIAYYRRYVLRQSAAAIPLPGG